MIDQLMGIAVVARMEGLQPVVACCFPEFALHSDMVFGITSAEFAKSALPGKFLTGKRFDFSIEIATLIRFVSIPTEFPLSDGSGKVRSFNVVFALPTYVSDDFADATWRAACSLSMGIMYEEHRTSFLSRCISREHAELNNLIKSGYFELLGSGARKASLFVQNSLHVHLGAIPTSESYKAPAIHDSVMIISEKSELQSMLPPDSSAIVRKIIEASDPRLSIRDMATKIGIPFSTTQRVTQHLNYWGIAKTIPTLDDDSRLIVSSYYSQLLTKECRRDFIDQFGETTLLMEVISCFSAGNNVRHSRNSVDYLGSKRGTDPIVWLLQRGILEHISEKVFYNPLGLFENKSVFGRNSNTEAAAIYRNIQPSIRKKFSKEEIRAIYSKTGCDNLRTEILLKFISDFALPKSDLHSAKLILSDIFSIAESQISSIVNPTMAESSFLFRYEY